MTRLCLPTSTQPSKRWSQPEEGKLDRRRPTLIVEPAPNLVALKAQLKSSHRIKVVTANRLKLVRYSEVVHYSEVVVLHRIFFRGGGGGGGGGGF